MNSAWLDEDPGDDSVYGECLARLTATRGQIVFQRNSDPRHYAGSKAIQEHLSGTAEVLMTIDDCVVSRGGHIADDDVPVIVARYKAGTSGPPALTAPTRPAKARCSRSQRTRSNTPAIPQHFPGIGPGCGPWTFHTAACRRRRIRSLPCWAAGIATPTRIYVVHAIRLRQALPVSHVAAIKAHPCWDAPVAWPHDGGHTGFKSTETFAATYRRLGLNMRGTHATFPRGGFNFESGITEIGAAAWPPAG